MSHFDCDLFVIGAGSGGVRASRMAAQRGARVVVAEGGALGGTCVNVGCIPKKLYSYAAHFGELAEQSHGFGWVGEAPRFDWGVLKQRRAAEIKRLNGVYEGLLKGAGVQLLRGWARLADEHTVVVDCAGGEQRLRARHILLATGGAPVKSGLPGDAWAKSSDDMFDLDPFPKRLVVVGGGYIACEFASIFRGLGAEVALVHRGTHLLRGFDQEMAVFLTGEMRKKGVKVCLQTTVLEAEQRGTVQRLRLSDGQVLEADTVLHATGRRARTEGLGLEALGITVNKDGSVPVDDRLQTNVPSVHALGDLVGRKALTPVALAEAMYLVDRLFGPSSGKLVRQPIDYDLVPTAVFTHPNVGTVGLSEEAARKTYPRLRVYRAEFKALQHTLSDSTERTLMKLLVDDASDKVVGLHMVGHDAGEVVQGFAVALQGGLTKAVFDRTLGIHPTGAEEFVTMREALRVVEGTAAESATT
ncbi:glutathione-disulfide reductase [Piscinibacter sp. HJYY11]|uniref:glutathione-disulfide reductase n=1 Tax=Piscinibacter sp. HJYY11 TaxID=2801333 RepID=UPI00191EE593|nr:glutathione-disulfide reductase [Piscinibacter sp. HJYY11]MBL0730356.1 glutathione-disulfide reductase [Piscinibacter sp. HJYY11]